MLQSDDPIVESPVVEFIGIEDDKVKVRDKGAYKLVSFDSIKPLHPCKVGDLVTLLAGGMVGNFCKVKIMTGTTCTIRKLGDRPALSRPDPCFLTTDLIQVYPAFK